MNKISCKKNNKNKLKSNIIILIISILSVIIFNNNIYSKNTAKINSKEKKKIDKILSNGEFPWYTLKDQKEFKFDNFDDLWDWSFDFDSNWIDQYIPQLDFDFDVDIDWDKLLPDFDILPKDSPSWECPFEFPDFDLNINRKLLMYITIFICVIILIIIILKILQNRTGLFRKSKNKIDILDLDNIEEIIEYAKTKPEILYEKSLEAAKNGDYSKAICYLYLSALNKLDISKMIDLNRSKTNWEYIYEIKADKEIKLSFTTIVKHFELVFFGQRKADINSYNLCKDSYSQIP